MTKLTLALGVALSLATVVSSQSGLAGKWTGEQKSAGGAVLVTLELTLDGSTATGTVTMGQNPSTAISDIKVTDNGITFKTTSILNGKEVPVSWEGDAKDNKLSLVRTFGDNGTKLPPIVLDRSK
jgi:hypothetical protein